MTEEIQWIDVSEELPDSGSEVLVCFERNDCIDRDVAIAGYDDSYEEGSHWQVDGGLGYFGTVLYWAEMPMGPPRSYLPPQVVATDALEEIREIWAGANDFCNCSSLRLTPNDKHERNGDHEKQTHS